jgi:hypothetical protein
VANLSGLGGGVAANTLTFTLADGLVVHFDIAEVITGNVLGNPTISATLRLTNVYAINTALTPVSDNIYIFSDVFNPSIAGTAGVGVVGYYGAAPGIGFLPVGGAYAASSQAQMNFLFAPLFGPGAAPGFSLTTPSTFIAGVFPFPTAFYEWARTPSPGGIVQLVGGLNFTLGVGSEIYMPGSLIVDDNDPGTFASEAPEPATFAGIGSGLIGLAIFRRRRK